MPASTITLTFKDDGSATIDRISGKLAAMQREATQGAAKMSSSLDTLKQNWIGITAAAAAAGFAFNRAFAFAKDAARFDETIGRINAQIAKYGQTATDLVPALQAVTNQQLSLAEAAETASRGLAAGFDPASIAKLTGLAEGLADQLGGSIQGSFEQLTQAISTGMFRSLKSVQAFAPVIDEIDVRMKQLADSTGRTVEQLTEMEKREISLSVVTAHYTALQDALGASTVTLNDQFQAFEARVNDLNLRLGKGLIATGTGAISMFEFMAAGATKLFAAMLNIVSPIILVSDALGLTHGAFDRTKQDYDALQASAKNLIEKGFNSGVVAGERLTQAINPLTESHQRLGGAIEGVIPRQDALVKGINLEKIAVDGLKTAISLLQSAQAGLQSQQERAFDRELSALGNVEDRLRKLRLAAGETTDPQALERLLSKTASLRGEAEQRGRTLVEAESKLLELERQRELVGARSAMGSPEQLTARRAAIDAAETQLAQQKAFLETLRATGGQAADDVDRLARAIEGQLTDAYSSTLASAKESFVALSDVIKSGKDPVVEYTTLLTEGFGGAAAQARVLREAVESVNAALSSLNNQHQIAFALAKQTVANSRVFAPPAPVDLEGFFFPPTPDFALPGSLALNPGDVGAPAGGGFSDFSSEQPFFSSDISSFARGGIVRRPTLALVGEAGPEAIVPLRRGAGSASITVNLTVNGGFSTAAEIKRVTRDVLIPQLQQLKD